MQESLFATKTLHASVPAHHPLRLIREIVNAVPSELDEIFAAMYADSGRDSIPSGWLLRCPILRALYGLRSGLLVLREPLLQHALLEWVPKQAHAKHLRERFIPLLGIQADWNTLSLEICSTGLCD